ncbi:MAG: holo-ACP synthase [Deltaproteobacteria bacterium]|nr:holo-ACP synthase [Candidatus Anaeroferrophillus wilburensis]MBN2888276.1 holo-ACP synthase [Deltaproteobacteria bacterium]
MITTSIKGIGTDIVKISRIDELISRYGSRFLGRIFTPGEISYCQAKKAPALHFAARFAAKEALLKSLGTGLSGGISWQDVEVSRASGEAPAFILTGKAAGVCQERRITETWLSLSHEHEFALAFVIIGGAE